MPIKTISPMNASNRSRIVARSFQFVLVLGVQLLLASCAVTGPVTNEAGEPFAEIDVTQAQSDPTIPLVAQEPELQTDAPDTTLNVRWGGTVAKVYNLPDNVTRLEIVSRPLSRSGRPIRDDRSSGRFIAQVSQFLDPQIVEVGRDVTITGSVLAREAGFIGETEYVFPIVRTENFTFWKPEVAVRPSHFRHWNSQPHRYYDPFRRRWLLRGGF